tara:strand:+ start:916 stop:2649 length:1734 start_codon:yes stop_codon:yes gene_type:complete
MPITKNGSIYDSFAPLSFTQSARRYNLKYRSNYLASANVPKRYQVRWTGTGYDTYGDIDEAYVPTKLNGTTTSGDIINMVFYVYATTQYDNSNNGYPTNLNNWDLVATIKKSRDLVNKQYNSNDILNHQRFTVDISQICQDLLSYSLVPIKKGTWQSSSWGGMNGGQTKQDNVTETVSNYNVTPNGSYRAIRVVAKPEVILSTGLVAETTSENVTFSTINIINSVPQFEKDNVYLYEDYTVGDGSGEALSKCPNSISTASSEKPELLKPVRLDEEAEWLYYYIRKAEVYQDYTVDANKALMKVVTSDGNSFYLNDYQKNLDVDTGNAIYYENQNRMVVQNVSPAYIMANPFQSDGITQYSGDTLTAITDWYRVKLDWTRTGTTAQSMSGWRYFKIDREDKKIPYAFVRFHWLNRMGGIDSYTAKRSIVESMSVSKDTIETKSADRTWYQSAFYSDGVAVPDADYISNTMRGGNLYKGGREVLNVNAEKNNSVYTEPLNIVTAQWLEEIVTSPNVWIEMETDATKFAYYVNPNQRPCTKGYIPVIITNSDVETVNQEQGLVKFNLEYTLSHKVQTQRN